MTTGYEPTKPPTPNWVGGRPFWGGLLLFLSGFELFLSSNLNLGALQVHFGPSGFLSYLLPAMLLLCGVLAVLSPGQRLFYGILGLLTALFSLIGLNLGGFFAGMLLGVLGGALTVAWAPNAPYTPAAPADPDQFAEPAEDPYADPTAEHDQLVPQSFGGDRAYVDDHAYAGEPHLYGTPVATPEPTADPPQTWPPSTGPEREGLLTDSLPTAIRSPLHPTATGDDTGYGARHAGDGGAGSAEDARPDTDGPLPRRRSPFAGGLAVLLALGALAYTAGTRPTAAFAAPACATATRNPIPGGSRTTGTPATVKTTAPAAGQATPTPTPSATAAAGGGNVVTDIINGIIGIFTGGKDKTAGATPSPTPTTAAPPATAPTAGTPTTTPAPGKSGRTNPSATCTPSASASPTAPKKATLAAGQPFVADPPSTMLAKSLTMSGLSYDGVVNLPTKTGSIAVLKFSMSKSVSTPFELDTPAERKTLFTKSSSLTVAGNVAFYTSSFSGKLLGLIPVTFTPSQPPPLILPELFFTDADIKLVFVQSDVLTAPGLSLGY